MPARSICEIGIAPVKPAEFVIFRLSQFSGGGGAEVVRVGLSRKEEQGPWQTDATVTAHQVLQVAGGRHRRPRAVPRGQRSGDDAHGDGVQGLGRAVQADGVAGRRPGQLQGRDAQARSSTRSASSGTGSQTIAQKGATPETVKEITLIACAADGRRSRPASSPTPTRRTTTRRGSRPSGPELPESITLKCTDIQIDGKRRLDRRPGIGSRCGRRFPFTLPARAMSTPPDGCTARARCALRRPATSSSRSGAPRSAQRRLPRRSCCSRAR